MKQKVFIIVLIVFSLMFNKQLIAQQELPSKIIKSPTWTLYQEQGGVQLFYRFQECHIPSEGFHRELVLIKLVNNTSIEKQVEWDIVLWYKDNCVNCDLSNKEQHRKVVLAPNSQIEGTCNLEEGQTLKMFSRFLNYKMDDWELTHFELRNFKVY